MRLGNCLDVMREMEDASVDSIVTDPPYGLSFMGKKWDYDVPSVEIWRECLRVLKPGGHLLAFAGTRTQHRMAVNIEDAGFEIRDMIAWVYGSGFPKSLNVGKAVDALQGNEREVIGKRITGAAMASRSLGRGNSDAGSGQNEIEDTKGNSQWEGWGTALKPALEPITVARKPFKGTVAGNVLEHGTGALNIDGCRVGMNGGTKRGEQGGREKDEKQGFRRNRVINELPNTGRWPANLIHDGSDEVVGLFPVTKSHGGGKATYGGAFGNGKAVIDKTAMQRFAGDYGSAARFFYCAKASKKDRDEGCEGLEERKGSTDYRPNDGGEAGLQSRLHGATTKGRNHHPTVKPTDLMRYLCRLVTPPKGIVFDPFMGSGSTGKAAILEGFQFVGAEMDPDYFEIAKARINAVKQLNLL